MSNDKDKLLRVCIFRPYRKGMGPAFKLWLWDTYTTGEYGKSRLGYRLAMIDKDKTTVIFEAEDFYASPMYAIDSNAAVASVMGFLTTRPGDTDQEYFDHYTPEQLDYCSQHAEALSCEMMNRFKERVAIC